MPCPTGRSTSVKSPSRVAKWPIFLDANKETGTGFHFLQGLTPKCKSLVRDNLRTECHGPKCG